MKIRMTGHQMTVTDGMRKHVDEKISRYDKYAPRLVESHVILKKEKYFFEAEITLLAKKFKAFGEGQSKENVFAAIDEAAERVETQLLRHREKQKKHRVAARKLAAAKKIKEEEDSADGED